MVSLIKANDVRHGMILLFYLHNKVDCWSVAKDVDPEVDIATYCITHEGVIPSAADFGIRDATDLRDVTDDDSERIQKWQLDEGELAELVLIAHHCTSKSMWSRLCRAWLDARLPPCTY